MYISSTPTSCLSIFCFVMLRPPPLFLFFFLNDPPPTEIYPLPLHDALPILSLFILLLVAVFLITGALAPPTDWDVLMYHLRVPKQFLQAGAIYRPEDNAHFAFVGLPHMLYLPLLALGTPEGPALVSALCTLGLALAGFAFGLRFLV